MNYQQLFIKKFHSFYSNFKNFLFSDPVQVPASSLPADSDELLERPEYWVRN